MGRHHSMSVSKMMSFQRMAEKEKILTCNPIWGFEPSPFCINNKWFRKERFHSLPSIKRSERENRSFTFCEEWNENLPANFYWTRSVWIDKSLQEHHSLPWRPTITEDLTWVGYAVAHNEENVAVRVNEREAERTRVSHSFADVVDVESCVFVYKCMWMESQNDCIVL